MTIPKQIKDYFEWLKTGNLRLFFSKDPLKDVSSEDETNLSSFYCNSVINYLHKEDGNLKTAFTVEAENPDYIFSDIYDYPLFLPLKDKFVSHDSNSLFKIESLFDLIPLTYQDIFILYEYSDHNYDKSSYTVNLSPENIAFVFERLTSGMPPDQINLIKNFLISVNIYSFTTELIEGELNITYYYSGKPSTISIVWSSSIDFIDNRLNGLEEIKESSDFLESLSIRIKDALKDVPEALE